MRSGDALDVSSRRPRAASWGWVPGSHLGAGGSRPPALLFSSRKAIPSVRSERSVDRGAVAAEGGVQEAVDLALGVVEAPGAGPAVGAAEDRPRPVPIPDPPQFSAEEVQQDRKSTRLNSSHANISYAVFCLKKKKKYNPQCI